MSYIEKQQNIPQVTEAISVSKDYMFDPSNSFLQVCDRDFVSIVSVFNSTTNTMMYQVGSEELSGSVMNNELCFDMDTSSMDSGDKLYILYQRTEGDSTETLLCKLIELQKETNKLLNKIYN